MTRPLLEVRDLCTEFTTRHGRVRALDSVSLKLNPGQVLGLVGESGSGKSVTGFSIMGLVDAPGQITAGSIHFQGQDLLQLPPAAMRALRGRHIAMIFQDPMMTLNPVLSIETQMVEAVQAHSRKSRTAAREQALEALVRTGMPSPEQRLRAYPHQLSGGMRQRVAIAIAMLHKPELIIADEPTTALDVTIQAQILFEMKQLVQQQGTALIWISHDLSVVAGLVDQVAVMYRGQVVENGGVDAVLDQPQHPYTQKLIASLPVNHMPGQRLRVDAGFPPSLPSSPEKPGAALTQGHWVNEAQHSSTATAANASTLAKPNRKHPAPASLQLDQIDGSIVCAAATSNERHQQNNDGRACTDTPTLQLEAVVKHFPLVTEGWFERQLRKHGWLQPTPMIQAVNHVDLQVHMGEIVGLVGESGCGKSTLGRIANGLDLPSSGSVKVDGVLRSTVKRSHRLAVQMVFQNAYAALNPRMRIDRIVGEGALRNGLVDAANYDDYVCTLLMRAGLDPSLRFRYPHQFSGGQRQRIGIARALAVQPRLLICDEAVAALDVSIQAQVLNLFLDLRDQLGLGYLFISHDLAVIRHLSDFVAVMYLGRIVESAPAAELFAHPAHPYTRSLLAQIPRLEQRRALFKPLQGDPPSPLHPPSGCHFHPRCPNVMPRCQTEAPLLRNIAIRHQTACHLDQSP